MSTLQDIVGYIYQQYPYKDELSKGRITKLIYLADWKMCLMRHTQISTLHWYFNQYGPYSDEIEDLPRDNALFTFVDTDNYYGGNKKRIVFKQDNTFTAQLEDVEKQVLDKVIEQTKDLSWFEFTRKVNESYPVTVGEKYHFLDLPALAKDYLKELLKTPIND